MSVFEPSKFQPTTKLPSESISPEVTLSSPVPPILYTIGDGVIKYGSGLPSTSILARKISSLHELVRDCPKISVLVPLKYPVTRIFQEESVVVEVPTSVVIPHAFFAHMRFPVDESFARKISSLPELVRGCPKISVLVPWNCPVTRIFQEESVEVEEPISSEMPQAFFAHIRFPVEESFARKISVTHELVRDCPKISVLVPWKYPVTRIFQEESVEVE